MGTKSDYFNDCSTRRLGGDQGQGLPEGPPPLDLLLTNAPDSPLAPEVKLLVARCTSARRVRPGHRSGTPRPARSTSRSTSSSPTTSPRPATRLTYFRI